MTPAEITTFLGVFQSFVKVFDQIGIAGLLCMVFAVPLFMLCIILFLNHYNNKRLSELLETYRADSSSIVQLYSTQHDELMKKHEIVMSQLKTSEQNNSILHTLVVNNTQAMERLTFAIEKNFRG